MIRTGHKRFLYAYLRANFCVRDTFVLIEHENRFKYLKEKANGDNNKCIIVDVLWN